MQVLFGALHKTWAAPCLATAHVALRGHLRFMVQSSLDVCQILSLSLSLAARFVLPDMPRWNRNSRESRKSNSKRNREWSRNWNVFLRLNKFHTIYTEIYIYDLMQPQNALSAELRIRNVCVCVCVCGSGMRTISKPNNSQTFAWFSRLEDAGPKMPERILCKLQTGGEP